MLDLVIATCGFVVVVLVWMSVLRTTLIPRRSSSRMARWTARACATGGAALASRLPGRLRNWVLDLCVPVSLFVMAAGWLSALAVGFALLVVAVGGTWSGGSPVVDMNGAAVAVTVAAGASAVLVAAAFAAYLVHFMDAYGRREGMIARWATQVQRVTDADVLVASHLRSGSRDSLDSYFAQWAGWLADIYNSHNSYPGLVYLRSAGQPGWPRAAMTVMDAAALVEAVAPRWAPLHARVLLNIGSCCLQCLARRVGIELPVMTVSLQGREERAFGDTMQLAIDSGLPAERDIDHAWMAFQEIRVRYAPYAALIGSRADQHVND
ncbi:MAG TPA: hypothetical protein VGX25_14715 [Actinophytocola sp.]|uniref:hypothetical protein n=1 Tax=Actinophytocola sp. TaxID=1872138 RepID=UPI002DDCD4D4|nr:hypothetical protein [Actinophytocola sp.]HEV2780639.1 hypothetical protein [Actinophytocola sp.]